MSDTRNVTSTQQYAKYYHGYNYNVHIIKPEEQINSRECFKNERKYDAVKIANETMMEAFVCVICREHGASCRNGL